MSFPARFASFSVSPSSSLSRRAFIGYAALFVCAAIPLTGCQQEAATNSGTTATSTGGGAPSSPSPGALPETATALDGVPLAPTGTFKIGLITPGKVSDKGWNASALDGVQRIGKELGASVTPPVEGPAPSEVAGALRGLAQDGNQLIFLHASEFDDAAASVAPDFPNVTFVVVGGRQVLPNLTPIQFAAGQATYLAGMLAGGMSKTGKVGCIGAAKIPIVEECFASFKKGAIAANPKADVRVAFTGDENDAGKAKQQAQAFLDAGVDVLMHNANAAGQGVAQAVSGKPGTYFIGANADQSDLATPQNLGSFIVDAPNAYVAVARAVKDGKANGKAYPSGLKEKALYLKYNSRFAGTIPPNLKAQIAKAQENIIAGKIDPNP